MKFTVRTHVPRAGADYEWASVVMYGREVVRYGDYYHEKGVVRAEGWIDGYAAAMGLHPLDIDLRREEFVDPECYQQ
jgi:hypothetical protein